MKYIKNGEMVEFETGEVLKLYFKDNCEILHLINEGNELKIVNRNKENVHVPLVLCSSEIINNCEIWLNEFKEVYSVFEKYIVKSKFSEQEVYIDLKCYDNYDEEEKYISLNLCKDGIILIEGAKIFVNNNDAVYDYLIAKVLDYVLNTSMKNISISKEMKDFWEYGVLKYTIAMNNTHPQLEVHIWENIRKREAVQGIIKIHNLVCDTKTKFSSESFISALREKISDGKLDRFFTESVRKTEKNYQLILSTYNG